MGKVFLSYSHKDAHHLAALRRHARRLEGSKLVELWHDEVIAPGEPWADSIRQNLDGSRLVLALVSPGFLQSEWCLAELGRAFELRDKRLIDVVPIIVRQCAWRDTQLGAIQALPQGGAPIESYPDPEVGWRDVVTSLESLLSGGRVQPALPARTDLLRRYAEILDANRRLMILAPWCDGLEDLAQAVAERSHGERVTLLRPPTLREMTAEAFYAELSGEPAITSPSDFRTWLMKRCAGRRQNGAGHLVVMPYFGGPTERVRELGHVMRGVFDQMAPTFSMLAVGSAYCAKLLGDVAELSMFCGIMTEHEPGMDIEQTRAVLRRFGADPAHAAAVQNAAGGHPEWTATAALAARGGHLHSLSQILAENMIYPVLFDRLMRKEPGRSGNAHAAATLKKLLDGKTVVRLSDGRDDFGLAVVRLYYDGVLEEREGRTEFRCEAARLAAERAVAVWEERES